LRRVALVLLTMLALAPAARADASPCGVTTTPVVGSAPLEVTLTAACPATS
jgi:hypothetical protein